ncbi:N-acetylmuramoyl-L-alanine amidase [Dethiosulfatibacter aminovorans DSM 17477]|uniref:N-acetylmuramoyl-L-alanine amidase n=1 Tax=Dethiosulfatibacter aminovorans DSM 17477 TaxID=1121476 RepID=A0A1M6GN23_9FIRM|nr:N-acetylmuramoyl-L-alanine amidase [Dethiosulfatibacter aminovorans]SHJ11377.1 N-acetylmuramoyl-L-alanine amidase [Dethiosulfatibacter aminovorans DSM 17477]
MKNWRSTFIIIVISFLLGFFTASSKSENTSHVFGNMNLINHDSILWINEEGIVSGTNETGAGEDETAYTVDIELQSISETVKLDISIIEYKILRRGDPVMVHYVYDTEKDEILYVQFIRDEKGRLELGLTRPVVVLDAGHGGFDDGEGSNGLWLEKELNLKITLLMKKLLEEGGIRVVLTRSKDEYVTLYDRCELSNYIEADMFISNHINKYNGWLSGIDILYSMKADESFAYDMADTISKAGLEVRSVHFRRDTDHPELDYYFVHHNNDSESYIVEYGYADNEHDAIIINENWEEMAEYAADAILRHFFHGPVPMNRNIYY